MRTPIERNEPPNFIESVPELLAFDRQELCLLVTALPDQLLGLSLPLLIFFPSSLPRTSVQKRRDWRSGCGHPGSRVATAAPLKRSDTEGSAATPNERCHLVEVSKDSEEKAIDKRSPDSIEGAELRPAGFFREFLVDPRGLHHTGITYVPKLRPDRAQREWPTPIVRL